MLPYQIEPFTDVSVIVVIILSGVLRISKGVGQMFAEDTSAHTMRRGQTKFYNLFTDVKNVKNKN